MQPHDNHILETIRSLCVPIHKAGWPFVAIFAIVTAILALFSSFLGVVGLVLTLWCIYFFRDPARVTPLREGLIISPADGLVQKIADIVPPAELGLGTEPLTRISIFLNLFNVHVNRAPIEGTVTNLHYIPGKFLNASLDKASEENERNLITITTPNDVKIGVIQIAGLVARRILCDLVPDQSVRTGEKFGIIRFGSRADIYLPKGVNPLVIEGQLAVGGETVLADLTSKEDPRSGERH